MKLYFLHACVCALNIEIRVNFIKAAGSKVGPSPPLLCWWWLEPPLPLGSNTYAVNSSSNSAKIVSKATKIRQHLPAPNTIVISEAILFYFRFLINK